MSCESCQLYTPSGTRPAVGQSEPALPPTYMHRPALAENKPPTAGAGRVNGAGNGSGPAPAPTRQQEEETVSETPKCKNHPDRDAKLNRDGRSAGLCPECVAARTEKARQARAAKAAASGPRLNPKAAAKQMAVMTPVLKGRAAEMRRAIAEGVYDELAASAQGVLAVLDIMGEAGAIPGWTDQ